MSAEDILGAMGEPITTGPSTPPPLESAEDGDFGTVSLLKPNQLDDDVDDIDDFDEVGPNLSKLCR